MTLKEDRDTLCHILYQIFELDDTAPLVKILKMERWDILSFVTEPELVITSLYDADEDIPSWQLEYINIFSEYFYYRQEYGEPLHNNWKSLHKHDFEIWIPKNFPSFKKPQMQPSSSPSTIEIPSTTAEQHNSLKHVLEILDHNEASPLTQCLQAKGIQHIDQFTSLTSSFIDSMTYPDTTTDVDGNIIISQVDVPRCHKTHVKIFQGYILYRNEIGKPIDNDWLSITKDDINKYKCSNEWQTYIRSCSSAATKMIHSHGEFKATNIFSSISTNQLPSDLPVSEITTANRFFSSPCGEDNSLVGSSTAMNHNLWQCKTSASSSSSNLKISENIKSSFNKDKISTEHNQTLLQPFMLKPTSELPNETLLSYNKISFAPEYKTKSEYLQQIDPEPPPYMRQRFMLRSNIPGLYTPYEPINHNTTSYISDLPLHLPSRYVLFKILHPSNKRMITKSLLDMGRDMFIKVLEDLTNMYPFKTKLIMEQLDIQDSFSYASRKRSTGRVCYKQEMEYPHVKVTNIHFCSMGSDRKYTSIFIGVLHHVYHIYLFSPFYCGMVFPSKVCPYSYGSISLPKDMFFICGPNISYTNIWS